MANKNPNRDNLGDFRDLTAKEQRKIASKGGKASVEARRNRRTFKDAVEHVLFDIPLNEAEKSQLEGFGCKPDEFNKQMLAIKGLMQEAINGNVQAFNSLVAIMGEKPIDKVEVGGDLFSRVRVVREKQQPDGFTANSEDDIPD